MNSGPHILSWFVTPMDLKLANDFIMLLFLVVIVYEWQESSVTGMKELLYRLGFFLIRSTFLKNSFVLEQK